MGPAARVIVILLVAAAPAAAEPPRHHATMGLMPAQLAGYQGGGDPGNSEGRIEQSAVTHLAGLHATYAYRPRRFVEVGPRLDLMYAWFTDGSYRPDAVRELRATMAIAAVLRFGQTELRLGFDVGGLVSAVRWRSGAGATATGATAGGFVTVGQRRWGGWGWFVDVAVGHAEVDGDGVGAYHADSTWVPRLALGGQAGW